MAYSHPSPFSLGGVNEMRKSYLSVVLLVMIQLVSVPMVFSQTTKYVSGIYSNLRYNVEGGDLLGMELLIFPSGSGPELNYLALIQIAEGGAPFAVLVPVIIKANTIEFTLPSGRLYSNERFSGKFVGNELIIQWSNGTEERLKRGKSYWQ
jgi:hypothetical protein